MKKRIVFIVGGFCLCLLKVFAQDSNLDNKDFYAAIADHGQQTMEGRPLETIPPVVLPDSLHYQDIYLLQYQLKQ